MTSETSNNPDWTIQTQWVPGNGCGQQLLFRAPHYLLSFPDWKRHNSLQHSHYTESVWSNQRSSVNRAGLCRGTNILGEIMAEYLLLAQFVNKSSQPSSSGCALEGTVKEESPRSSGEETAMCRCLGGVPSF